MSGAGAPTVRKSCTFRIAPDTAAGAMAQPIRQPVTANVFDAPLMVTVRSAIPGSVAMGTWGPA